MALREDWIDGEDITAAVMNTVGIEVNGKQPLVKYIGFVIIELSPGVWSADVPVRAPGEYPIEFRGVNDPRDVTNGVDSPANINNHDTWVDLA